MPDSQTFEEWELDFASEIHKIAEELGPIYGDALICTKVQYWLIRGTQMLTLMNYINEPKNLCKKHVMELFYKRLLFGVREESIHKLTYQCA